MEAYKQVYDLFRTKKSFNLQSMKKSLMIAAALFVLLGNIAQAGLPTVDKLQEKYQDYFDSLDKQEKVVHDKGYTKKLFINAMDEIEEVYNKLKDNKEFKEDISILKKVIDNSNCPRILSINKIN